MNQHWTVRLNDVAEINPKAPKGIGADTDVAFVPMAAVSEDGHLGEHVTRPYSEVSKGYSYFERGDLLLAKITPCFENGKAALVDNLAEQIGFGSTEFHVLRPSSDLDAKYLFYLLWNERFRAEASKAMTGSAGQKRVPADLLRRTELRLPPLGEQRQIAAILDKADALRQKRKRAIALLDSLTQSIFLEMFGDPVTNPKRWPTGTLADMVHQVSDGPHVSPRYSDDGVPFLSTRHIGKDGVTWADLKFISPEDAAIHWKKCKPERGDILYTKGGTTGIACVVDFDTEVAVWVHVALLKTDAQRANPRWLAAMLNSEYCYRQSQEFTHGIANRDLGLKRMVKIRMFLPPLAAQQTFADRVARLAEIGRGMSRQLEEVDRTFASLQHRAFSGQL